MEGIKIKMVQRKQRQNSSEELVNTMSHAFAAFASFGVFVILINGAAKSPAGNCLFSIIVYGLSLIFVYMASALYHLADNDQIKKKLRILDHAGIFLMIAGTYTPVLLLTIGGTKGWVFFFIQWMFAAVGIVFKLFFTGKYEFLSLTMYLLMGWLGLCVIDRLYENLNFPGFFLLLMGGCSYTVGIIFYSRDHKIRYGHLLWHLFVIKGSAWHFLMIFFYII